MVLVFSVMNLLLKNKYIYFKDYKLKCAIGKRGITDNKIEGDKSTPKGRFKLKYVFYRKDRLKKVTSKLRFFPIKKNYGWCDDTYSKYYNKFVKLPFKFKAEKLYLKDNKYDLIIVLDYNLKPVRKNKGSAIFLHIAKKDYRNTLGCIAVSKINLKKIIQKINKSTIVNIN